MQTSGQVYRDFFILLIFIVFFYTNSLAGNTATNGVAPRAQSMQAFTAVADDPSAIFYNPAGLVQLKGTHFDNGVSIILPYQSFTSTINNVKTESHRIIPAPNLFISTDKVQPVVLGFGVYSPFAREAKFDINAATLNLPNESKFVRIDFVPTAAIRINEHMAVGAGFVASRIMIDPNVAGLREKARGYGLSGQGGVLFFLPHKVKLGVNFRGPMTAHIHGTGYLGPFKGGYTTSLKFPAVATVGAAWQATQQFLISAAFGYEFWHTLTTVNKAYDNPVFAPVSALVINAKNSYNLRGGVLYRPSKENEFRGGYSYLSAAVPASNIVPAIPDFYEHHFSLGYSRYRGPWRFDLGYEFAFARDRFSNNVLFTGDHTAHLHVIMLGAAYQMA